jgi:hypothetical protein
MKITMTYIYQQVSQNSRDFSSVHAEIAWAVHTDALHEIHRPLYEQVYIPIGFVIRTKIINQLIKPKK